MFLWPKVFLERLEQKANTLAEILVDRVYSRFGRPITSHSHQGRNFESNLVQEICSRMVIHKSRTTAYNVMVKGTLTARTVPLREMLVAVVSDQRNHCDNWVSLTVYA